VSAYLRAFTDEEVLRLVDATNTQADLFTSALIHDLARRLRDCIDVGEANIVDLAAVHVAAEGLPARLTALARQADDMRNNATEMHAALAQLASEAHDLAAAFAAAFHEEYEP